MLARPCRRGVQGLPRREGPGPGWPHGPARQDLPHQRLLDVHPGAQAGRGRQAPEHRDRHQLRAHRPRRRARQLQRQGLPSRPLRRPGPLHELRRVRPGVPGDRRRPVQRGPRRAQGHLQAVPAGHPQHLRGRQEGPRPLQEQLPVHTSAQGYIALIAEGRFAEAYRVAAEPNPFPPSAAASAHTTARPPARAARSTRPSRSPASSASSATTRSPTADCPRALPVTFDEKVAIIGGGPAGLTAARDLAPSATRSRSSRAAGGGRHAPLRHPRLPHAPRRPPA